MRKNIDAAQIASQHDLKARQLWDTAECLIDEHSINLALSKMAEVITQRFSGDWPLIFCVMNGGLLTSAALLLRLQFPLEIDYLHVSRYQKTQHGQKLFWRVSPQQPIANRHVIIVDDILDEGATLLAIKEHCLKAGASSVTTALLVEKRHDRKVQPNLKPDICFLEVPDRFVFGYGMDYEGYWRNAPGIYALKKEISQVESSE